MGDLYPTKTRVELLRAVKAGAVYCARLPGGTQPDLSFWGQRNVTARAKELEKARWVRRGGFAHPSMYARRYYELTEAGRKVLEEVDRG